MVFSSVIFLCFFLPLLLLIYRLMPGVAAKNAALTVAGLLFYAYGEPLFVFYLLGLVLLHHLVGKFALKRRYYPKGLFALLLAVDIFTLFFFKYFDFTVGCINSLFGCALPQPQIALPIGISFFTFQIMSYGIDSYRDRTMIQPRYGDLLLYISFFPQLIAGPIVKYGDIASQLRGRVEDSEQAALGFRRFVVGLSKKVILSNQMALVADALFACDPTELAAPDAWLAMIAYSFQIYYDFSGYSDMAIGLGQVFGFTFPENFNYPYSALSITDFWKRWHISLTSWFRSYVYIPLGGNRKGKARTLLNILIVFLLTGIWHGANYTFIVWGLYFALFMILERLDWIPVRKVRSKFLRWAYSTFVVFVGFVIFRAETLLQAWQMIRLLFSPTFSSLDYSRALPFFDRYFILIFAVAVAASFPISRAVKRRLADKKQAAPLSFLACAALLVICLMMLATDSYNPFIYFNF